MAGAQSSFVWYELLTRDVAAAKVFYGEVVGWAMQDVPMPGMTYTLFSAGSSQVGGMMRMPQDACDAGTQPFWATYIDTDDVDAAATRLRSRGGALHKGPDDIPEVGRFAVVADPQGAMFNLFKPSRPGERGVSNSPGQVGWHELHTKDWSKAWEFYSGMFGWQKGQAVDMGPMGTYQTFLIGGAQSGAMFNSPAAERASFWLIYFSVGDIDAAGRRIAGAGGKINSGPHQVPGGQWIIQAADPQGAAFAVLGTKAP
jgi:predicted enzyme related to lactoylglutathione lyase